MQVGFKSDKGLMRNNNEDACFVLLPDKVYVVADGVGGGNAGEIASRTAVSEIANYIVSHPIAEKENKYAIVNYLQGCLDAANRKIYELSHTYEENSGMATTVVIVYAARRQGLHHQCRRQPGLPVSRWTVSAADRGSHLCEHLSQGGNPFAGASGAGRPQECHHESTRRGTNGGTGFFPGGDPKG